MTALFVGILKYSVNGALCAYFIEGMVTSVSVLVFLRARHQITIMSPRLHSMKMLFLYGIRYHLGKISNFANLQMGTMFMAFFASKVDVGNFAIATQSVLKLI